MCVCVLMLHHVIATIRMFIVLLSAMASVARQFSQFGSDFWSMSFYVHLIFTRKPIYPEIEALAVDPN